MTLGEKGPYSEWVFLSGHSEKPGMETSASSVTFGLLTTKPPYSPTKRSSASTRATWAVKQQIQHGQFGAWLHAEFGMTERMTRNDMRAVAAFGAKTDIMSDLPPTAIYTLAAPSTPTQFRSLDRSVALAKAMALAKRAVPNTPATPSTSGKP